MLDVYRLAAVALFLGGLYALYLFFRSHSVLRPLYALVAIVLGVAALVSAHMVVVPFLALALK